MKNIIVFIILALALLPAAAMAEDPLLEQPRWSLEFKGGLFTPDLPGWSTYYNKKNVPELAATVAYKLTRQVETGVEVGMMRASGHTYAEQHQIFVGDVTYQLYPVNVFVLARGILKEDQWLIPYLGGGWTRMYYRQRTDDGQTFRGNANGYHVRGGLQFSLDILDQRSSSRMYADYGIYHTYFFIEVEYTSAVVKSSSTDLGGTAYLVGLLFEL